MKRIIVTDSLRDFIDVHARLIAGYDNKLFYTQSGRETLEVHRKEKADLLIITPDFPDMTCEELCHTIRADDVLKKISILVLCSSGQSDVERCMHCGASDYLTQPADPAVFLWKATRLLHVNERTNYRVVVKVTRNGSANAAQIFCSSKNISSSGVLLESDHAFAVGEKIVCSFFLPKSVRIMAEGQVMRLKTKENGLIEYGVRFVDPPPSLELQIASFVENWRKKKN